MKILRRILALACTAGAAFPQDGGWPTYMHDARRSGVTDEELALPLHAQWSYEPFTPPSPSWPDPAPKSFWQGLDALQPRVVYDRAFAPVAVGDAVWIGSSSEDWVACFDAATGERRWLFHARAPVRFAPTVVGERLVFASDDGFVYGLDRADGTLLWERRLAPEPTMVPGNGRLVSAWPVRTGLVVEDGIVHATAGLFPAQGTWGFALDVADGSIRWKVDLPADLSPQGYLLLSPSRLFVPNGRAMPFAFARADGAERARYGGPGGAWALVVDDALVTGPSDTGSLAMLEAESRETLANFAGRRMVVRGNVAYLQTDTQLSAVNRRALVETPRERNALRARQAELTKALAAARDDAARDALTLELGDLADRLAGLEEEVRDAVLWTKATRHPHSLILAGDTLFAGGDDEVGAYDAISGQLAWTGTVRGRALALAAAEGRLLVSTNVGVLQAFGAEAPAREYSLDARSRPVDDEGRSSGGPSQDVVRELLPYCDRMKDLASHGEAIESRVARGYALVLDAVDGALADALDRAGLETILVARTPARAARLRESMSAGRRRTPESVRVLVWKDDALPFPDGFANLVVSETSLRYGTPTMNVVEMARVTAPSGGTVVTLEEDGRGSHRGLESRFRGEFRRVGTVSITPPRPFDRPTPRKTATVLRRGPRAKGGRWTHAYADAANTSCSGDRLVGGGLALQWFGPPGPSAMVDRHLRTTPPLAADGILFVPGRDRVIAVDAYNGAWLWEREIADFTRTGSPFDAGHWAVGEGELYLAAGRDCRVYNTVTGQPRRIFQAPEGSAERVHWGWLALAGDSLLGTAQKPTAARRAQSRSEIVDQYAEHRGLVVSERVFSVSRDEGTRRWTHETGIVLNTSLTAADASVFLLRTTNAAAVADEDGRVGLDSFLGEGCELVALDLATGAPVWTIPFPEDRFRHSLFFACDRGVLVAVGSFNEEGRNVYALLAFDAATGALRWRAQHENNRGGTGGDHGEQVHHPVLAGGLVIAEPRAYDLETGELADPAGTGEPFFLPSRGGCGTLSGAEDCLFFRDSNPVALPLTPGGTRRPITKVSRPGCWISILPAGGLVLLPEASSGCVCAFPLQTSMALRPR